MLSDYKLHESQKQLTVRLIRLVALFPAGDHTLIRWAVDSADLLTASSSQLQLRRYDDFPQPLIAAVNCTAGGPEF